jgi:hypothetical protein
MSSPKPLGLARDGSVNHSSSQNFMGRKATQSKEPRMTRGESMLTPSDWEPNGDGNKVEKFLSKLEKLDGLAHTSVRRNRKTREVLKKYRDGNYSFSLLEKDLSVV